MSEQIRLAVIAGPTGVGKTASSIEIAKKLNGEIICCDSMQIYKGMDIGTAKVTPQEAQGVPHHMVDVVSPMQNFSVCDYAAMCRELIEDISRRGRLPIMVGGTGLYIDTVVDGIDFADSCTDEAYRREMEELAETRGCGYIHSLLEKVDPESAASIHPNNIKRVIRALEYYKFTGTPISQHNRESKLKPSPYHYSYICLTRDREELYSRIDMRVDIMLRDGLVDEVKDLTDAGVPRDCTAMQAIGYKEVAEYLEGDTDYDTMVETLKRNTRRYAKRQLTWFRRREDVDFVNLSEEKDCVSRCIELIKRRCDL